jgi:hypothetical protein
MGEVVGLGRFRKERARAEDKRRAEENRIRFGRTRAEREAIDKEEARADRVLDAHRRDDDPTP